jgi:hypothetical protein
VLDAALFEPGQWQEAHLKEVPTQIPADNRDNLNTVTGGVMNLTQELTPTLNPNFNPNSNPNPNPNRLAF